MTDHLAKLAEDARNRVKTGYYDSAPSVHRTRIELSSAIEECRLNPIIAEVKFASPSQGMIRRPESPERIAEAMVKGGACSLSVLTEPDNFDGGLNTLARVAEEREVPVLMKDVIVAPVQLEAGRRSGADAVVLVSEVFSRRLGLVGLDGILEKSRSLGLEVLAEANGINDFLSLKKFAPDLYGINNRNLSTLRVDLSTTETIMSRAGKMDGPVVTESGIDSPKDVTRLRNAGAEAFLVGTSIMKSSKIEAKVRELVQA